MLLLARSSWLIPFAVLAFTFIPASAQEPSDTFRLGEIVVTATRLPTPRGAVPAAVSILNGEDLRSRGIRFVADALREVPGASVVRTGSHGGLTSLFLRGGESDYVQVMVDGVVLNDPGGAIDLGQLTTENIDRIEVVRGPVNVRRGVHAWKSGVEARAIEELGDRPRPDVPRGSSSCGRYLVRPAFPEPDPVLGGSCPRRVELLEYRGSFVSRTRDRGPPRERGGDIVDG